MKKIFFPGLLLISFLGCSVLEPAVDNTRFYILSPTAGQPLEDTQSAEELAIGLGPVHYPAYLNRPWIAIRENNVEIDYAESHQWSEPLEQGIQRVLRDNLETLLGTSDITIMRQTRRSDSRYLITLDFSRFELEGQNAAILNVAWRISNSSEDNVGRAGSFETRITFETGGGYTSGVAALSETLAELSEELAIVLREN